MRTTRYWRSFFTASVWLLLAVVPRSDGAPQDKAAQDKKEGKKVSKIEVQMLVVDPGGKPITRGTVKMGLDEACSKVTDDDLAAKLNEQGEAVFKDVPACSATVIVAGVDGYSLVEMEMGAGKVEGRKVNLAEYKKPIRVVMKKK